MGHTNQGNGCVDIGPVSLTLSGAELLFFSLLFVRSFFLEFIMVGEACSLDGLVHLISEETAVDAKIEEKNSCDSKWQEREGITGVFFFRVDMVVEEAELSNDHRRQVH